ncbi:MAG: 2-C-methyl-D-erythritol 4-phosphate cytidylyltransferase [Nocardioidaceae bacterium]
MSRLVRGGSSRHQSEHNAFEELGLQIEDGDIDIVVIHDAARPLALPGLFSDVIQAARGYGGALPVRPAPPLAALNRTDVLEGETDVVTVQTPQAFRARPLLEAYRAAALVGFVGTDTASCIERFTDIRIKGVRGDDANIKLTYAEDLLLAERLLSDAGRAESAVGKSRVGDQAHG